MNKKILILSLCLMFCLSTAAYALDGWDCYECGYRILLDDDYSHEHWNTCSRYVAEEDGILTVGQPSTYTMRSSYGGFEPAYSYQYEFSSVVTDTFTMNFLIDTNLANFLDTHHVFVIRNTQYNTPYLYYSLDEPQVSDDGTQWSFRSTARVDITAGYYNPRVFSFEAGTATANYAMAYDMHVIQWSNFDVYDTSGNLLHESDYDTGSEPDPEPPTEPPTEPEPDPECTCSVKCELGAVNASCEVCSTDITGCEGVEPGPDVYTISFETGFEDITLPDQSSDSFVIPSVSKDGYIFKGWYLDEALTVQYVATYEFTADTTLYASWEEVEDDFVISFVTGFDDLVIEPQLSSEFVYPSPEYEGYTFEGWFFDSSYTLQYTVEYVWTRDTTLYAKWSKVEVPEVVYTISFETGFDALTVEPQMSNALSPPKLEMEGYIFLGWYTDSEFKFPYTSASVFDSDATLYAKWAEPSEMESFHQSIFSGLKELLSAKPIVYLLSLIGLVLIIGIIRKFIIPNIN